MSQCVSPDSIDSERKKTTHIDCCFHFNNVKLKSHLLSRDEKTLPFLFSYDLVMLYMVDVRALLKGQDIDLPVKVDAFNL
jgi:hypothetical protein